MRDSLGGENVRYESDGAGSSPAPSILKRLHNMTFMAQLQYLDSKIHSLDEAIAHQGFYKKTIVVTNRTWKLMQQRRELDEKRKLVRLQRKRYPK
jgi:hypothetical protein